jgi:hypothetical protein
VSVIGVDRAEQTEDGTERNDRLLAVASNHQEESWSCTRAGHSFAFPFFHRPPGVQPYLSMRNAARASTVLPLEQPVAVVERAGIRTNGIGRHRRDMASAYHHGRLGHTRAHSCPVVECAGTLVATRAGWRTRDG